MMNPSQKDTRFCVG